MSYLYKACRLVKNSLKWCKSLSFKVENFKIFLGGYGKEKKKVFYFFLGRFLCRERVFFTPFFFSFFLDRFLGRKRVFLLSFINSHLWIDKFEKNLLQRLQGEGRVATDWIKHTICLLDNWLDWYDFKSSLNEGGALRRWDGAPRWGGARWGTISGPHPCSRPSV